MSPRRFLTGAEVQRIRQMRGDGYTAEAVARTVGCGAHAVLRIAPGYVGKVPNDRLRQAFLASGVTAADVARLLGWESKPGCADTSRVRRTLGLIADVNGQGNRSTRSLIDWETGSLIAEAIGVGPWEVLDDKSEAA